MNEKMKQEAMERLIEYLGAVEQIVKSGKDFAAEQMPLVAQEIIAWGLWSNVASIVFALIVLAAMARAFRWAWRVYDDDCLAFFIPVGAPLIVFSCFCIIDSTMDVVKTVFAPRLYVLEELKRLVK